MDKENDQISDLEELDIEGVDSSEKQFASKDEVIAEFESLNKTVKNFRKRLSYTALGYIRSYFYCDTIREMTSDDVVQIVCEKILTGKRKWDKKRFPDLLDFIRITMLSFVRNEQKRVEKIETCDICDKFGELEEWKHKDYLRACLENDFTTGYLEPESYQYLYEGLFTELKEDVYATFVLEKRLEGVRTNVEIAESLQIEVRVVENALKRIKRRYLELQKRLKE